ncbi:MAG: hypothetical protein WDN29_04475 [Methylovirgula sp.]
MLDDGRIIERGTHRSLLAADGRYTTLYNMQSEAPAEAQSASAIYEREAS